MVKAEEAISELLMKCDEKGIQSPENPWQALREAITALRNTKDQALGCLQVSNALEHLANKFGTEDGVAREAAAMAPSPRVVRTQKRTLMQDMPKRNRRNMILESDSSDESSSGQSELMNAMSPVASSKKKYAKKIRLQEQVEANPAARNENQPLVDQLVQLGEYEMRHGKTQRGLARLRAAKEIRDSRMVITTGAQARQLDHVGPSVATKIDQLLNEGLVAALSEYEGDAEAMPVAKIQERPTMNLRQAQRSLAELISKCEAAHIQLPKDSLEARSEAVESIIHSLKDGKPDLKAAQEELQQKYGIELVWKQHMENEEAKRQRRRQSRQKKCGGGKTAPSPSQGSMNLGLLPEMPARLEVKAPTVLNLAGGEPLQGTMKNVPIGGVVTLSKRPAASQETPHVGMKIAKKAKSTQGLIVSTAPSDTEEKPPPRSAAALGNILSEDNDDNNESASSGNPDHDIVDLLDLEDLNEVERGGGMSSDEEFAL